MMSGQARHPFEITKRQELRDLSVPCLYVKEPSLVGTASRGPHPTWTRRQLAGALAQPLVGKGGAAVVAGTGVVFDLPAGGSIAS